MLHATVSSFTGNIENMIYRITYRVFRCREILCTKTSRPRLHRQTHLSRTAPAPGRRPRLLHPETTRAENETDHLTSGAVHAKLMWVLCPVFVVYVARPVEFSVF